MTVPEATGFPVTITDADGDAIEITVSTSGLVAIRTTPLGVELDAAQRETFAQAWIAACHEADRQARPVLCGALSPPPDAVACCESGGHGEHIARLPGGVIAARWPVSDG
jgi:hypothetical protein